MRYADIVFGDEYEACAYATTQPALSDKSKISASDIARYISGET